jgi:tetratricopeptide (TPR) repeat protein
MPHITTEVNHTSNTDHRIPRQAAKGPPTKQPRRTTPGPNDLVAFHAAHLAPDDEELPRNHGLALMAMLDRGLPDSVARGFAEKALPLLDRAVGRDWTDVPALTARADALWLVGRRDEAQSAYEAALKLTPDSETTLHGAANVALAMNRTDQARSYFQRAVRLNPWNWRYHHGLAVVSFRSGDWERAIEQCRQALRLEPTSVGSRSLLVQCYLGQGQPDRAKAEYQTIRQLTPEHRRLDLQRWFQEQLQRLVR